MTDYLFANAGKNARKSRISSVLLRGITRVLSGSEFMDLMTNVITVSLSGDLKQATVFVNFMILDTEIDDTKRRLLQAERIVMLNQSVSKIRFELGKIVDLRGIPRLEFRSDKKIDHLSKIHNILSSE